MIEHSDKIINALKIGVWLCIHRALACNDPLQQSKWLNRGKAEGFGIITDIITNEGIKYIVFQVEHGWQTGNIDNHYLGAKKCIPISEFMKQTDVMYNKHDYDYDWYVWTDQQAINLRKHLFNAQSYKIV